MELGCFLAGVVISAQGHGLGEEIENMMQPLKDFLAAIFFSSIGVLTSHSPHAHLATLDVLSGGRNLLTIEWFLLKGVRWYASYKSLLLYNT